MHLTHSYPVVVKDVDKAILRFFKCMESMVRDLRHPYIPSTTVLGDTHAPSAVQCIQCSRLHLSLVQEAKAEL